MVNSTENAIMRDVVVHGGRLKVVQVLEAASIRVTSPEWHESISVPNSVALSAVQVVEDVVLNNGVLTHNRRLSPCSVSRDAVTESKHVLELIVLEGVPVDINKTLVVAQTRVDDNFPRL